ncbi:MAG: NAD-dependent epimerase/dehydratase family protein [Gammaproteobacteria bacterium]
MKRILVTGASGFIGNACINALIDTGHYEIHAVSSRTIPASNSKVFWHLTDLHDPPATRELVRKVKPTHLLHLAWYAIPGKCWSSPENYKWVESSFNLLQSFSLSGGERCVTAGSCAEYSWENGTCQEERTPLRPATIYGQCKNSLHSLQQSYCREVGLSCAWGRVFYLYGPHEPQQRLVSSIIVSLINGEPAMCSHGKQVRDYLFVKDVASAFIALLESDYEGAVNIASGHPVALREIIMKLADRLDGHDLIRLGALPAATNEPDILVCDTSRLNNQVGWQPEYSLDRGLDLTIEWWRKYLSSKG